MKHLVIALAALAIAGCQTAIKGNHEFDRGAPFETYSSFAWITSEPLLRPTAGVASGPRISGVMESNLRRAVERELHAKGYRMAVNQRSADLVVSFSVGTREKIRVDSQPVGAGYRYGRYGAWGGGMQQTTARSYTEGTLAIDFFDVAARQAVWHGWATKRLSRSTDQATREATINEAVSAILGNFPYSNTAAQ